ncbi:uncharacterized protein F4807DRAFT_145673 [Annulohypoxylon truncatum]|uniref:uncharacterized protein n=1 Tax=Annulohypoxylon truncatum TaxID=327061 RepID=UPI002008E681|nr:uncharacterized protein F4807DRAFT_145673 [Annulohypoxylon truncatum]KAI1208673.1 hypothetical protein F4807DRAFT_145673 [Annulohypoxylon truncatum]
MPRYSPLPTSLQRSRSVNSVAASDSTYHSFHDIELYEPSAASPTAERRLPSRKEDTFEFKPILRHDSGYESIHPKTRSTASSQRRNSSMSTTSSHSRPRTRPSMRRAAKSSPIANPKRLSAQPLHLTNSQQQPTTYYYFPPPESLSGSLGEDEEEHDAERSYPPPPQTTHYWTSDHTRRLEYAAIDAASRGVKGWFMKHVVPDCFVPKASRRVGFDDDSGSVRRYRLELDNDESGEKTGNGGKKMGWLLGR